MSSGSILGYDDIEKIAQGALLAKNSNIWILEILINIKAANVQIKSSHGWLWEMKSDLI